MSRYIARVVSPSGTAWYLCRGREVSYMAATRYPHPSAAWRAGERYAKPKRFYYDVIDTRDEERIVP